MSDKPIRKKAKIIEFGKKDTSTDSIPNGVLPPLLRASSLFVMDQPPTVEAIADTIALAEIDAVKNVELIKSRYDLTNFDVTEHIISKLKIGENEIITIRYNKENDGIIKNSRWLAEFNIHIQYVLQRQVPIFVMPENGVDIDSVSIQKMEESIAYIKKLKLEKENELLDQENQATCSPDKKAAEDNEEE